MNEPMEYATDSMWNTLSKYTNEVRNIPSWSTIPYPLLCSIKRYEYHIELNNIKIEKLAETSPLAILGCLKMYAKT